MSLHLSLPSSPRKGGKKKGQTHTSLHPCLFPLSLCHPAFSSHSQQARQGAAANQQIPSQTRTNPLHARSTLHENKIKNKKTQHTGREGGTQRRCVAARDRQDVIVSLSLQACCFFIRYGAVGVCLSLSLSVVVE